MKTSLMRALDKIIGVPICFALAQILMVRRVIFSTKNIAEVNPGDVKNLLCIKFFGAGSIFLAYPLFKELRIKFPNAKIHLITFDSNQEFVKILNCVDIIHSVRKKNFFYFSYDIAKYFSYFLRNRIDISVDLEFFAKFSILLAIFYMARCRVGFYSKHAYRGELLSVKVNFNHYRHISEIFYELGKAIGVRDSKESFTFKLPSFSEVYYSSVLVKLQLAANQSYIIVNINSSDLCSYRNWPAEKFYEFCKQFLEVYPHKKIVLIGHKEEAPYVHQLKKRLSFYEDLVVDLSGRTNISELLALIEHSELMVTNDSGPAHFTSASNTPCVVLFGPETPSLYKPINPFVEVIYQNHYCSPCVNVFDNKGFVQCKKNSCMWDITEAEVMSKVQTIFKKHYENIIYVQQSASR
ncbi:MAG: glycosyltransferase family 9 protein [Oligoflexia bacterium]|nr:glycosyltransferase family 9 protein [Oligoflexia bacterium]